MSGWPPANGVIHTQNTGFAAPHNRFYIYDGLHKSTPLFSMQPVLSAGVFASTNHVPPVKKEYAWAGSTRQWRGFPGDFWT
jgi:hypothetical protein